MTCHYLHNPCTNNPKKIQRMIGATDDDMKVLLTKRFIIAFESGIVVIKHWKMHNYIQADRFKPTPYREERNRLMVKDNKAYKLLEAETVEIPTMYTECVQNGSTGKDSIDKDSIDKISNSIKASEQRRQIIKQKSEQVLKEL